MVITNRTPFARILVASWLLAIATGCANAQVTTRTPQSVLTRILGRVTQKAYSSVRTMVSTDSPGGSMVLKFEGATDGSIKYTVLQPLSSQGIVMIDDGSRVTHYYPDQKLTVSKPSPRVGLLDVKARVSLAANNYFLSLVKAPSVAGRKTVMLEAKPKRNGLPTRKYIVDASELVLLRSEILEPGGDSSVVLDTQTITFFSGRNEGLQCDLNTSGWRKVTEQAPPSLASVGEANRRSSIDFELPEPLPYGMEIQGLHLKQDSTGKAVLMRLTDGLASVSVYIAKASEDEDDPKLPRNSAGATTRGISFVVVSDFGKSVNSAILRSFLEVNRRPK